VPVTGIRAGTEILAWFARLVAESGAPEPQG
jgi:hypothetical protein